MKQIKTFRQSSILLAISMTLVLGACTSSLQSYDARKRAAPTGQRDLGVVITGADEGDLAELLENNPSAQYRLINKNAKQYEVFNVQLDQIQKSVRGEATPNTWIQVDRTPSTDPMTLLQDSASASTEKPPFEPCEKSNESPSAEIKILVPEKGLDEPILTGTEIQVTGHGEAHKNHPGRLKIAFLSIGPTGATQEKLIVPGESLRLTVDTVGVYQLAFIVQDERNVCTLKTFMALVTDNPAYVGDSVDVSAEQQEISFEKFSHLGEVEAEKAWAAAPEGGEGILIAVLDSGVNYNHPALLKNIKVNTDEIPGNNLDDDGNGLKDDYVGYDFKNDDGFPFDDDGHGSHVAGLAASSFFGLAPKAKILPVKTLGHKGGDTASLAGGIRYAVERKAKIINMSFGNYAMVSPLILEAMNYAEREGVLVVAASGNGDPFFGLGVNTDRNPMFPASLPNINIVSVAAKSKGLVLASYSNFGPMTVDIAAPGGNNPDDLLMSAAHANPQNIRYVGMSGTSMASPIVAGIAALVWSTNPLLSALEIKDMLLQGGSKNPDLESLVSSGSYVNARQAVELAVSHRGLASR